MNYIRLGLIVGSIVATVSRDAVADEFVLSNGSRVVGELLNPDQIPRTTFEIKTLGGTRITLDCSQVEERIQQRAEELEYEKIWPRYADTVEDQWKLAEWCLQRQLLSQRDRHLERILKLDPEHEQARRALGYSQRHGEWKTREEEMLARGFVRHAGKWVLPQTVQLIEQSEKVKAAEGKWQQDVNRWRTWLNGDKARQAQKEILSVDDPSAVKALAQALNDEPSPSGRILYVKALANVGTTRAMQLLAAWALNEPNEEVRLTCLDYLKKHPGPVDFFAGKLQSTDNGEINRAGYALKHLEDPAAVPFLIDALVTAHKYKVTQGGGQTSAGFSNTGAGGLSMGSSTKIVTQQLQNRSVLEALVALASGPNFGYDVAAWKSWYASQQRSHPLDARRD